MAYLLGVAVSVDYLHRQLLAIALAQVSDSFQLIGSEMGWLLAVYALTFVAGSLFLTFTVERFGYSRVLCVALAGLGASALLSAFSVSYSMLIFCRALMGLCAAVLAPAAQSIIVRDVSLDKKTRAASLIAAGGPFGLIIGFSFGGWIAGQFGWQWAFAISGLATLLLCVRLWRYFGESTTVQAEQRHSLENTRSVGSNLELFRLKSFIFLTIGFTFASVGLTASVQFNPAILVKVHGVPLEKVGLALATIFGVVGMVSSVLSGRLSGWLERYSSRAPFWICIAAVVISAPLYAAAYLSADGVTMLVLLTAGTLAGFLYSPQLLLVIQNVVPGHLSARALGLATASFTGVSMGLALPLVGWLSDELAGRFGDYALNHAMVWIPSAGYALALLFFVLGAKYYPGEVVSRRAQVSGLSVIG
ncbi:MAG: MFS transporter [bacterium]